MNVLGWNCRGTATRGFPGLIRGLCLDFQVSFLILMETHVSGDRARSIYRRFGFNGMYINEARGHSGGIWCLWDAAEWNVQILFTSEQMVHMKVKWRDRREWFLTAIYGNPHYTQRQNLWVDLQNNRVAENQAWAIIGDFNSLISGDEREGPPLLNPQRTEEGLLNTIDYCGLIDAGFVGDKFTWLRDGVRKRLDRVLVNLEWRIRFEEALLQKRAFTSPFYGVFQKNAIKKLDAVAKL